MDETRLLQLPDGRELAWLEVGEPAGPAVLALHGTPGSRRQMVIDDKAIAATGVRLLALDRPGYGHSTLAEYRHVSDLVTDVTTLADHLEIDRFSVIGYSGGGPFAAACARFLADRVSAVAIVSGVGPLDETGAEKEMMGFNQLVTRMARRSRYLVYPAFALVTWICRRWPERVLKGAGRQLPPSDVEVLGRPQVRAATIEEFRHASATTAAAAAQDFALFTHDWGFRLEDIVTPVHVWHGDADRNVPLSHGRLLAERIPGAQLHVGPGQGHMLFYQRQEEILRTLASSS